MRPVIEALKSPRREVFEIFGASENGEVEEAARASGVPAKRVPKARIEDLSRGGDAVHQGFVARVGPYPYSGLEEILADREPLVVVLDGVTDPRNLGAVLRAADGVGASGVLVPKDRAAGVTPAAVKASAGASEHVRVARETNLRRAIDATKRPACGPTPPRPGDALYGDGPFGAGRARAWKRGAGRAQARARGVRRDRLYSHARRRIVLERVGGGGGPAL